MELGDRFGWSRVAGSAGMGWKTWKEWSGRLRRGRVMADVGVKWRLMRERKDG